MARKVTCFRMLRRLVGLMKLGASTAKVQKMSAAAMAVP